MLLPFIPGMKACAVGVGGGELSSGVLGGCEVGEVHMPGTGLPPSLLVVGQKSACDQHKALLYIHKQAFKSCFFIFCQNGYGGGGGGADCLSFSFSLYSHWVFKSPTWVPQVTGTSPPPGVPVFIIPCTSVQDGSHIPLFRHIQSAR